MPDVDHVVLTVSPSLPASRIDYSLMRSICDFWIADLQTNVDGLSTSRVPAARVHRYASWSPEQLYSEAFGERHLAVWPELDAVSAEALTVTGDRLATQTYAILVWQNAADSQGRMVDDDVQNAEWLQVGEDIERRLMVLANSQSGHSSVMITDYIGLNFQSSGVHRVLAAGFTVRVPLTRA